MNDPATQSVLLVGLPYASIFVFLAGLVWRHRRPMTISALSSQMIESRWLVWGAVPFHLGVVVLFLGHIVPMIAPAWWQTMVSNRTFLLTVESTGAAAAILALAGLLLLLLRRVSTRMLRPSSTAVDVLVLLVLIAQVTLGLGVATMHRWGAVWSARTTAPYLWSVVTLRPEPALVAGVPMLAALHLTGAWIVLALLPFTRLVHMFSLPLGYLVRRPQKVVWMTPRVRQRQRVRGKLQSLP